LRSVRSEELATLLVGETRRLARKFIAKPGCKVRVNNTSEGVGGGGETEWMKELSRVLQHRRHPPYQEPPACTVTASMSKSADPVQSNAQIFRVYLRRLSNPADQDIFVTSANKLATFLSNTKAYYDEAQQPVRLCVSLKYTVVTSRSFS